MRSAETSCLRLMRSPRLRGVRILWLFFLPILLGAMPRLKAAAAVRPNILWFVVDDMSPDFGCYGAAQVPTPNVDRLAREGTRFSRAFTTAPVCSPCRSALITGMFQTSIGAHHHRSGRGIEKIRLGGGAIPLPKLFQAAGYYTCNGGPLVWPDKGIGKTDYNFEWDPAMYDGNDWSGRRPGQPFFMQVQLHGGKYREGRNWGERVARELGSRTDPNSVALPPYYPRDPVLMQDWADYLDTCRYTDLEVGRVIGRLEREGILDQTLIVFMTDHGISHARGKQFLYDEGTHIPLVVRGPGIPRGAVRDDLVSQIDLAATSLGAAGLPVPRWMQGKDLFARGYRARSAVFAARDRCDETVDHLRSIRTDQWFYIRNYLPLRPALQPNAYKDAKPIIQRLREMEATGMLDGLQRRLLFAPIRPVEELYEWTTDGWQLRNVAGDPRCAPALRSLRRQLARWEWRTGDMGRTPESDHRFESDMAVYRADLARGNPGQLPVLEGNIALMKRWAANGR